MAQYLLSIYQPDGPPPPDLDMAGIVRDVGAVVQDARDRGAWVFNGALFPPSTATVVRVRESEALMTDGPFTEGREHLGGFLIVAVNDLDEALEWGRRLAQATTLPIEVRPFADREG